MTNVSFLINLFLSFPFAFFSFQIDWFLLWNMHYNWILEIYSSDKCYLLIMFIFALTISVIQGYIHKLSPVIKRAKNSTAFTSFFYKKVESKRFPWQEFKRQMLVFVGFHPILWCMTLKSLCDICMIFFLQVLVIGAVILSFVLKEKIFYRLILKSLLK